MSLRQRLIRLAYTKPELRKDILPLVRTSGLVDQIFGGSGEAIREGDTLEASWGIDQDYVTFYHVGQIKGNEISLIELEKKVVRKGEVEEWVIPTGSTVGPSIKRKLQVRGNLQSVKIRPNVVAYKWDGKPVSQTRGIFGR